MAKAAASPILQLLHRVVEDCRGRDLPDRDLLQRFHAQNDQAAFHTLLRRHGPMLLDVCRGVLGDGPDAEDAFQATFLVLAQKAGSIRKGASLGSWLHGVARRTALKARAQSAVRQKHEARAPQRQASQPDDLRWREVRQVLHEELDGIAERYREPLVLCYLEGATQQQAAARLGLAERTVRERLERGRELLRLRLVRRGLGPAAILAVAAWPAATASAAVPAVLLDSTTKAATLVAAGGAAAPAIPVKVAALTEGVLKTMSLTKLKIATTVLMAVGVLAGVSAISQVGGGPVVCAAAQQPEDKGAKDVPKPQPQGEDDDPNAKWPADPPRILEHDPYLLVPRYDGNILSVGCVAKELKLTDKQIGELWKLDRELSELLEDKGDAMRRREYTKAMHEKLPQILTPSQVKRFQQVGLQLLGIQEYPNAGAMGYPEIQQTLKLGDQQKENIRSLNKGAREAWNEEVNAMGGIDVPRGVPLLNKIHKATLEKALLLLDKDQRATWDRMVGEPFTFTIDRFRLDDKGEYTKVEK